MTNCVEDYVEEHSRVAVGRKLTAEMEEEKEREVGNIESEVPCQANDLDFIPRIIENHWPLSIGCDLIGFTF